MKTDMYPTSQSDQNSTSIKDRVFSTIDQQHVTPRPCYVFWCENTAMWLIWLATVVLGALATAVLLFTSTYRYYDLYEAMHDNFVTFFVQALPIIWVVTFVVLMVVAMSGLRATRRGYRLSPWLVGGSSIGVSVLLGVVASALGFGFLVDKTLGQYAPMYYSQAEREQALWQMPAEGRLVGVFGGIVSGIDQSVYFTDVDGSQWVVFIGDLPAVDQERMLAGKRVRLLGAPANLDQFAQFHACGVFSWMLDKKPSRQDLSAERSAYIKKMHNHSYPTANRLEGMRQIAHNTASAHTSTPTKLCAEIATVRRIQHSME